MTQFKVHHPTTYRSIGTYSGQSPGEAVAKVRKAYPGMKRALVRRSGDRSAVPYSLSSRRRPGGRATVRYPDGRVVSFGRQHRAKRMRGAPRVMIPRSGSTGRRTLGSRRAPLRRRTGIVARRGATVRRRAAVRRLMAF